MVATVAMTFATSCSNDLPEFNDSDAFVALRSATAEVDETGETLSIPVLLTSLSGVEGKVDFEITPDSTAPAKEGVNYSIENESKTLSFTKDANMQYIKLKIIDNSTYNGDVRLNINLVNPQNVNLGSMKTITVTIADDEHPLAFMLGSYAASGTSYFDGATEWDVTISKDDNDVSKVWIGNLVPSGSSLKVFGVVNDDHTEIHIPVKQEIATSSSYPHILLDAFYGADGDTDVNDYIVGKISVDANGVTNISFADYWFGSHIYTDEGASVGGAWYNIMTAGSVFKKK